MRRASLALGLLVVAFVGSGAVAGCGSDEASSASASSCVSTREYFTAEVYGKAMVACAACHTPGGAAEQRGAKFKMYRDTYPDFVSANLNALRQYSRLEVDDTPLILLKPLGEWDHGGGKVLTTDSGEYKTLKSFIGELRAGGERQCNGNDQLGVEYLENRETARKAAITIAGRFPTEEELKSVETNEGLDAFVEKLTDDELFFDRLREIWNDALLTERRLDAGVGDVFNNAPQLYNDKYGGYSTENRNWTTASVTQEPLRFIEYVVRNRLPFSDVVSGNYVVANPFTATLYGLPHDKPLAPESFLEWKRIDFAPVQNRAANDDTPAATFGVPVAGVLATPAFLSRWETTPTNKGRKRARVVLKTFLATDILKFAQRPVDSTALTSVQNPTANSPMCSVCHTVIDPIAGGFRGFAENTMTRFSAGDKWHDDMLPPGFNSVQMPPSNYGNGIMWLGAQIPRDSRFGISVAQVMFRGLVGDEPLSFPQDKAAKDYTDHVRAFTVQSDWFVKTGADFAASNFDLRKLVVAIVRSSYFRAKSGDAGKDALHDGLGQGRLLTPEMLGRKYKATTGLYYFANESIEKNEARAKDDYRRNDLIIDNDWRLTYGGIDSEDVTKRAETMSPIMLATSQYTASIVACRSTSYDFTKPAADRRLFKNVELTTTPFAPRTAAGQSLVPSPDAEVKIRENIKYLYWRLLGQTVDVRSPEVDDAYSLFVDVWKDHEETNLTKENGNTRMTNNRCVAENDWDKPARFAPDKDGNLRPQYEKLRDRPEKAAYEAGMVLNRDENFTVRSWQAVMTFLLQDYRFTHE